MRRLCRRPTSRSRCLRTAEVPANGGSRWPRTTYATERSPSPWHAAPSTKRAPGSYWHWLLGSLSPWPWLSVYCPRLTLLSRGSSAPPRRRSTRGRPIWPVPGLRARGRAPMILGRPNWPLTGRLAGVFRQKPMSSASSNGNIEHLRDVLAAYMARKGLRSTEQRRLIVETFFHSHSHITIEELL